MIFFSEWKYLRALAQRYEKLFVFRAICTIFALDLRQSRSVIKAMGVPGFDSRQSLIVSTSSAVWRLVNPDAQKLVGNNNYALAA